jgi:hypothetical protein
MLAASFETQHSEGNFKEYMNNLLDNRYPRPRFLCFFKERNREVMGVFLGLLDLQLKQFSIGGPRIIALK